MGVFSSGSGAQIRTDDLQVMSLMVTLTIYYVIRVLFSSITSNLEP